MFSVRRCAVTVTVASASVAALAGAAAPLSLGAVCADAPTDAPKDAPPSIAATAHEIRALAGVRRSVAAAMFSLMIPSPARRGRARRLHPSPHATRLHGHVTGLLECAPRRPTISQRRAREPRRPPPRAAAAAGASKATDRRRP